MTWNPDPRWPDHIVGMAMAIANGEDCRYALHDAFLELELPKCADDVLNSDIGCTLFDDGTRWPSCYILGFVLQDGYKGYNNKPTHNAVTEAVEFLNKRGIYVPAGRHP